MQKSLRERNKIACRKYYQKNKEVIRETNRLNYYDNRERNLDQSRKYHKTEAGILAVKRAYEKTKLKPKDKVKASIRRKTRYIFKDVKQSKVCETCDSKFPEIHHRDYKNHLDIQWLCKKCHMKLHRKRDIMGRQESALQEI